MVTYMERHTVLTYMSVTCTRRTLRMPRFTRAMHAQPSLSNFPRRDSDFGERARSRRTTRLEQNFPTSPQNKKTKLTHCSIYPCMIPHSFHLPLSPLKQHLGLSIFCHFVFQLCAQGQDPSICSNPASAPTSSQVN